jgi:uncharacterized protein YfkK (UPF0435 family)
MAKTLVELHSNMIQYRDENRKSAEERMVLHMNLNEKSQANVEYMIEQIKTKLRMATGAAMQASAFSVNQYDDIYDLYDMVMNKQNLSISEVEAVVSELGQLRGNH